MKLSELCSCSPAIAVLRTALHAHRVARLDSALSALAAETQVTCSAAFALARSTPASVADLAEADCSARAADASVADASALANI